MIADPHACAVCGKETFNGYGGVHLCNEHAAVARRLAQVQTAKTEFDLIGSRSHGERDSNDGIDGRRTTYDIVPEGDVEELRRDVSVLVEGVPVWAVETLFQRIYTELDKADVDHASATLFIKLEMLNEGEYERLKMLERTLWVGMEIEVLKTRIYPPNRLMKQKVSEVDQERREQDARAESQSGDDGDVQQAT